MRSIAHTRTMLLRAAARIVEQGGGKSLTTLGTAHEAHLAVGSVYRYFGDRNALLAAAVAAQRWEMLRELASSLVGATPDDVPRIVVDRLVRSYAEGPSLAHAGLDEQAEGSQAPAALIATLIAPVLLPDADEQEQSELAATVLPACRLMESSVAYASPVEIGGTEQKVLTAAAVAAFTACRPRSEGRLAYRREDPAPAS